MKKLLCGIGVLWCGTALAGDPSFNTYPSASLGSGNQSGSGSCSGTFNNPSCTTMTLPSGASGSLLVGSAIGTPIINANIPLQQILAAGSGTIDARLDIGHFANTANKAGELILFHSRGTSIGATGALLNGDQIGTIGFNGDDGAGNSPTGAAIYSFAQGDSSTNILPANLIFDTGNTSGGLIQGLEIDDAQNILVGPFGSTVKISDNHGNITGPSGAFFPIPTILTTSQAQLAAGSTTQAFADVTGLFVNEVIYSGFDSSNFLDGTQIVSLIGTVELATAANGTSASGQKVITVNDTTNCVTGMAVASGAHLTAGSLVTSINPGVSITIDRNLLTNITNGTAVVCDPVAVMNFASTSGNPGGTAIDFYRQFPGPSYQSSLTGLDASFFGDLGVAGYGYVGPNGIKIWDPSGNLFGVTIAGTTITGTTATIGTVNSTTALNATGTVTLSPGNAAVTISPTGGGGTLTIAPGSAVGTINRVSIGQTTPEPGTFTTETATTSTAGAGSTAAADGFVVNGASDTAQKGLYDGGADILGFASKGLNAGVIDASQRLILGNTAVVTGIGATFQNITTGSGNSFNYRFVNSASSAASVQIGKSRSGTINSHSTIVTGDVIGQLIFPADDGTTFNVNAAQIQVGAEGTVATGKVPGFMQLMTANSNGTMTQAIRIDSSQNINVGAGPTKIADSSGNLFGVTGAFSSSVTMPGLATSSAAQTGTLCWTTGTGNLTVDTTTTCLLSSGRFKQNDHPLDAGLSEVMGLRPVSYELKPEYDPEHLGRQVGFIAEDVAKVDDRLVGRGPDGEIHGVRYLQMTAVLAKAIQDEQHEIEAIDPGKGSDLANIVSRQQTEINWLFLWCGVMSFAVVVLFVKSARRA